MTLEASVSLLSILLKQHATPCAQLDVAHDVVYTKVLQSIQPLSIGMQFGMANVDHGLSTVAKVDRGLSTVANVDHGLRTGLNSVHDDCMLVR